MAKNYQAQIAVKDNNSISTLKKIVEATTKLKKELEKINSKPITIEAKTGSSFKNVQSQINKVAPKSKKINFEATENVTKTMSNVNRQVFEMNKNIKTGLQGAMKGFNTSLNASLPKIQALSNGMALASNVSRMAGRMAGASALAGVGAGAGTAALLKGGNKGSSASMFEGLTKQQEKTIKNLKNYMNPSGLSSIFKSGMFSVTDDDMYNNKKITNSLIKKKGFGNHLSGDKDGNDVLKGFGSQFVNPNALRKVDESFGKLIRKQQARMAELGNPKYLSRFKSFFHEGLNTDFGVYDTKKANKDTINLDRFKRTFNRSIANMQLYANNLAMTPTFQKMKRIASNAFNSIKRVGYSAFFAIERSVFKVGAAVGSVKRVSTNIFNSIKSAGQRAFNALPAPLKTGLSRAFSLVKSVASRTWSSIKSGLTKVAGQMASTITKTIGGAFSKVASMAKTGLLAAGAALAGATGVGVKGMLNQEQQMVSIRHFMKVGDAKANGSRTKDDETINKEADKFFNDLTNLANTTPFENQDIYASGRRMMQIFEGNSDFAYKMTQLSADMAALNPGKTAQDAAEALADLAMGETERMKEFGFKFSQDQLKAMIGKTDDSPLTSAETMKAFEMLTADQGELTKTFGGGAADISKTTGGKWSTVLGKAKQMMVNAVKPLQDGLSSAMDKAIGFLDNGKLQSVLTGMFQSFVDGTSIFQPLIESLGKIKDTILETFGIDANNFSFFDTLGTVVDVLGKAIKMFADSFDKYLLPVIGPVIERMSGLFSSLFGDTENSFGGMQGIIDTTMDVIATVLDYGSRIIEKLGPVFEAVLSVVQTVWPSIKGIIEGAWNVLGPIFDLFGELCLLIADIFEVAWPVISDVVSAIWTVIEPILTGIVEILKDVVGWARDAVEWVGTAMDKAKEWGGTKLGELKEGRIDKVFGLDHLFGYAEEDGQHAAGLNRVPRDGYKAVLHEGERVLTAREAREADNKTNGNVVNNTFNISGVNDPEEVVRLIVQKLKDTSENLKLA